MPRLRLGAGVGSATRFRTVALCLALVSLQLAGCGAFGVEPTDVSNLKPGAARGELEAVLGEPLDSRSVGAYELRSYQINLGKEGYWKDVSPQTGGYAILAFPVTLPAMIIEGAGVYEEQRASLAIAYSSNGFVEEYWLADAPIDKLADSLESGLMGDQAALRELAEIEFVVTTRDYRFLWTCRLANDNDAKAQEEMGVYYWTGRKGPRPAKRDIEQAYVWFKLAARNGERSAHYWISKVTSELTEGEVIRAERLLASWQPLDCEAVVAQAVADMRR